MQKHSKWCTQTNKRLQMAYVISLPKWNLRRRRRQQPWKQSVELCSMGISDFKPPKWLKLTSDDYKRILNLEAIYLTKRDRRRNGRYQVKEALVAVHNAFHNCNGTDAYDGMPLEWEQLKPKKGSDRLGINFTCKKHLRRMPTVGHLHQEPIAEFEILSRQTYTAKNEMTADEYLNHCKAVVSLSETTISE